MSRTILGLFIAAALFSLGYWLYINKDFAKFQPKGSKTIDKTNTSSLPSDSPLQKEAKVILKELESSGVSGEAVLKEQDNQVLVNIKLTGVTSDMVAPAHIHLGSCSSLGSVAYPLDYSFGGLSTTYLGVTFAELKKNLPLAINVHKSSAEFDLYTSCGDLAL